MTAHVRRILPAVFALLALLPPNALRAGVGEWTSNGPEGAVVETLAAHPSHPAIVYASTVRRLYKSVDTGVSWAPTGLSAGPNLVLPTSDLSVVYATATWSPGIPIFRTTDGGETWVQRAEPPSGGLFSRLLSLAAEEGNPMVLYAATDVGLFRSSNGADTWEPLASPGPLVVAVAGIAVDPLDRQILYAAVDSGNVSGIYRSLDGGRTWTRTAFTQRAFSLVIERVPGNWEDGDSTRVFALTSAGLQVTDNGGVSWRRLAPELSSVSHLAIDPAGSSRLYVISGANVFRSSDGGETVNRVSEYFGGPLKGIVAAGSPVVLVGSERGVSRSENGGGEWSPANRGIHGVYVQSLAVDPVDPAVVFAAGARGIFESRDGGATWNEPVAGSPDAVAVMVDPTDRSTLYAGGGGGVHKSTDGGRTWRNRGPLVTSIAELLIDPNNPRRLFAGAGSLYRSPDGADSWRGLLTPDANYSTYYGGPPTVEAIAIAPSDSSTIYAGGETGFLYRSTDGGDNWSDLKAGIGVGALSVDSCDPRIVQAGSWNAVWRSLDGGESWNPSVIPWAANFPYGQVLALARDPRHSSSAFAGTTAGLFWTNDRGISWKRFEPTLDGIVQSLALDPSGRFLYAGTERGVFQLERTFEACADGADRLCLMGGKYQVSVTARDRLTNAPIPGRAIREGNAFGYFSFPDVTGDPNFPEVFVKMADATAAPPPFGGHAWVFHSSLTDLDYTLTVLETETGRVRTYEAADSESLTCGRADTSAFERDCAAAVSSSRTTGTSTTIGSGADLSLLNGRFRATLQATDPRTGRIAAGTAIARGDAFGYFSLPAFTGDPNYPEIFVKMADATAQPGASFWVFHTGLTDLSYTLTVTDQATGAVRTYAGGATGGTRLCGSADTAAFRN